MTQDWGCSIEFVKDTDILPLMESVIVNKDFTFFEQLFQASIEAFPVVRSVLHKYKLDTDWESVCRIANAASIRSDTQININDIKSVVFIWIAGLCFSGISLLLEFFI